MKNVITEGQVNPSNFEQSELRSKVEYKALEHDLERELVEVIESITKFKTIQDLIAYKLKYDNYDILPLLFGNDNDNFINNRYLTDYIIEIYRITNDIDIDADYKRIEKNIDKDLINLYNGRYKSAKKIKSIVFADESNSFWVNRKPLTVKERELIEYQYAYDLYDITIDSDDLEHEYNIDHNGICNYIFFIESIKTMLLDKDIKINKLIPKTLYTNLVFILNKIKPIYKGSPNQTRLFK